MPRELWDRKLIWEMSWGWDDMATQLMTGMGGLAQVRMGSEENAASCESESFGVHGMGRAEME